MSKLRVRALAAAAIAFSLASLVEARAETPPPVENKAGVVFVLGGIGGCDPVQTFAPLVFPLAGVEHEVRIFDWTHGKFHPLRDVQDTRWLLRRADELADKIKAVKADCPDRPVFIIAHSAGTAVALYAAEKLPPGTLDRLILLAPAVSPSFDLRPALRATKGEVVVFHSKLDVFMLGWGTSTFGTADRYYLPAAGVHGFDVPDDLDPESGGLYERLVQSAWKPEMLLERGFHHNAPCLPLCLGLQVAPWLIKPVAESAAPPSP
jgi:pimeloyl-ACP methyl ester carboxylesterase